MSGSDPTAARERIGPYRIVARVGAGGMGEVFKAWDPRLEREVAIKLLHRDTAGDAERQKRLLAEGRAASALNHPNILRVYDADVDGELPYLVTEWLEGQSLRGELARGALPIKRLLDLAVQIAEGLAAAHAMGIVHRDIKPENVMLARDGTARIVDFGLARVNPHVSLNNAGDSTQSVTISLDDGLSGTPPYMSPEQARGHAGDFRTDQFSFGTLLYEMATGVRLFRRGTAPETLAAVINDEPAPIAKVNARVPVPFSWVVEQCLAKDPADRYAATEDLARELRRVRDRLREDHSTGATTSEPRSRRLALATVVGTAALALGVVGATMVPATAPAADLRFTPIASEAAYEGTPVWSPNGESIAWVADVDGVLQIFARRLADAVPTQLTRGRFDAEQPFWSPDGKSIYFIAPAAEGQALWTVGSAGGRAELVLENVNHAAIDPAGRKLALFRRDDVNSVYLRLWWSDALGQNPVLETRPPFDNSSLSGNGGQLQFRGDGQALLMWVYNATQRPGEKVSAYYLVPVDPANPIRETLSSIVGQANLQPFSWLPDHRHVVVGVANAAGGNRHLWIADTESSALRRLTATHTNETFPSASPDGLRIAYASEEVDFDLVTITEDGRTMRRILATARNEMDPAWSPLGDQFAYVSDRTGAMAIWVRSRDGQWERPVVTGADFGDSRTDTLGAIAYSPDGRTLAFQRRGPDQSTIWLTPATGGAPVLLFRDNDQWTYHDAPSWSPDGEWISVVRGSVGEFALAKIRVGSSELVPLFDRVVPFTRPAWSPDGRWIVCETFAGLAIIPADGGQPRILTTDVSHAYTWSPDSRRIVALVSGDAQGHFAMIEIDRETADTRMLNPDLGSVPIAFQPIRGFSYVKGQGFLTSLAAARSDIWLLEGFSPPTARFRLFEWWPR